MTDVQQSARPSPQGAGRSSPRLANTRLWSSRYLSRDERYSLEDAAAPARTVRSNIDLVREGERANSLFMVIEGWACRYTTTGEGSRQIPAVLVPGDVGNLDSLMFDQHPGIAKTFTWLALVENVILSKWALSLGRRSAKERLAHLLCELSVRLDAEDGAKSSFVLPMTQEQIADALGLTSVHVNRTMQQLRAEGLVVTAHRVVTLPDVAGLRRVGGFDPSYLHFEQPLEAH